MLGEVTHRESLWRQGGFNSGRKLCAVRRPIAAWPYVTSPTAVFGALKFSSFGALSKVTCNGDVPGCLCSESNAALSSKNKTLGGADNDSE